MEIRQLEYFRLVSRLGSVTKAAEQAHVAQPAVSIAIQKLEAELGLQLFDRSQKQFILTPEGRTFLRHVEAILTYLHDAVAEMDDYRDLQKGSIRIGIPPMLGAFLFPHIFSKFRKKHPNLELNVVEEGTLAICNQLEQGELDVGVIMFSSMADCLATIPITTGEIYVCLPPGHSFGAFSCIPFSRLGDQPFILLQEDTYVRKLIVEECARYHFSPQIVFSSSQIETILGLVEQGIGITFLLEKIARKHSNIISRPLENPLFIQAGLAWNRTRYLSNASQAFIRFIKASF